MSRTEGKIVPGWEPAKMPEGLHRKRPPRSWVAPNVGLPSWVEQPIWRAAFGWLDPQRQEQVSEVQMIRATDGRLLVLLASARHKWAVLAALSNDDPHEREWLDIETFKQLRGDVIPPAAQP
ncbi:hypothetical protein [Paraburkholderia sp. BR10882]|uniref:hypothetical protein n=1 Tax=unclassified Paraburkholderia TaxID=2615204 RepID=UPI0034CE1F41